MKYVLLVLFIGIPLFTAFWGYKKGFLKTLVSMLAIVLSFVLVYFFAEPIAGFLTENTSLHQKVETVVYEKLAGKADEEHAETDQEYEEAAKSSFLPSVIIDLFNEEEASGADFSSGSSEKSGVTSEIYDQQEESPDNYLTRLSAYVADLSMSALGIIITLIVSFILLKTITLVTGILGKIPLIGGVNRILGLALGLVRGLVIIWIICFAITLLAPTSFGESALAAISESKVLSLFYSGALSFESILARF